MKILIDERKRQLKANLHCHSVLSDGRLTPEQMKQEYQKRGYSVVAITDHERLVSHHDLTDENFLFLTAYEAYIRTMPFNYKTGVQANILFWTNSHTRKRVVASNGERVFSASFTPTPDVKWVCVEVTDCYGKKAFTRAFYEEEWEE